MIKKLILLLIFIISFLHAQNKINFISTSDTFKVNLSNQYELRSLNISPFSESVFLNKSKLSRKAYQINYITKILSLSDSLSFMIGDTIVIEYETILTNLKTEYRLRSPKSFYLSSTTNKKNILEDDLILSKESVFGKNINATGAIIRGFTIGTSKDFTLNSGLRLQLSGKLSDDINIVAALTDENTPIQPEGNTERLDELDKVYIEIQHPKATFTFGDYDFNSSVGIFGKVNRKIQGIKVKGNYLNLAGEFALAGSKGKFNTLSFNGSDGNQGPYRLFGVNSEKDIIIIAGSEKVYLDGIEMKRGENNDYVIEYSNAQITFSTKRLITSASRIIVDFEYTDRQYQRNFFGSTAEQKLFNDKLQLKIGYFKETDDFANPIDLDLSEDDKKILSLAGDDKNKAATSGVTLAKPDSSGLIRGNYEKVDSLIEGNVITFYRYNPGSTNSVYNVVFSYVGVNNGDYVRKSSLNYKFVGNKKGDYLPIKFISLPESMQSISTIISSSPLKNLFFSIELSGSDFDRNRLSTLNDSDNKGFARNINVSLNEHKMDLLGVEVEGIKLSFRERFIDKYYHSLDRFNSAEFNRDYNIPQSINSNESLKELSFDLNATENNQVTLFYGSLKKGNILSSDRYRANFNLSYTNADALYDIDYVKSNQNLLRSDWTKQNGSISYKLFLFKPGVDFYDEYKKDINKSKQLLSSSFRFKETGLFVDVINVSGLTTKLKYSFRNEYFPIGELLLKESDAVTKQITVNYSGLRELSTNVDFIHRKKEITDNFKAISPPNSISILIRSNSKLILFNNGFDANVFYSAATQKTARYERIFVRVEKGQGNYKYIGDFNNNGINDENEFEPTNFDGDYIATTLPTDELFPVIDLKTNFRLIMNFEKLFGKTSTLKYLSPFSTETVFRIEENSRAENINNIYFLKLKYFLNDSTTIRGNQFFQNDIYLFKNKNNFSIRYRFTQRKSLNQFSGGNERGFFNENNFRLKSKLIEEIANQTELIFSNDNLLASSLSNRERIYKSTEVVTDFTYLPYKFIEIGFRFSIARGKDYKPIKPTEIEKNEQGLRINFNFTNAGRLRFEADRIELKIKNALNNIPFEITRGNVNGKNYFWSINFDYKVGANLQTTVSYSGRLQPKSSVINLLRAEARAFF